MIQDVDVTKLNQLGLEVARSGQHAQAIEIFRMLAEAGLAEVEPVKSFSMVLAVAGDHAQAEMWIRHAISIDGADPVSHNVLSYCLIQGGRYAEASDAARRAISLAPRFADAHNNLGLALNQLGRNLEALRASGAAVRLQPDSPANLLNHANVLRDLGRPAEALVVTDRACSIDPDLAQAHYNRGNILQDVGRHGDAVLAYDRAVAIDPSHSSAHWNRALCNLMLGDFEAGWSGYEWRWKDPAARPLVRQFNCPLWLGKPDLSGRSILIHCEQGLGDALQFIRYAPMLADLGATVYVEAFEPLAKLFSTIPGLKAVLPPGRPAPDVDFHCPLMSLPLALWDRRPNVPSTVPYVFPSLEQRRLWRHRLSGSNNIRIGLAYCGRVNHKKGQDRSIPLSQFLDALPLGPEYYIVQTEPRDGDVDLIRARPDVRYLGGEIRDFADTAAICQEMDLIISVDTSVAHLAGALNRPLIVLLPYHPDWRWGLRTETTAWYPSARLWRQTSPGDWRSTLGDLRNHLELMIAAKAPRALAGE